MKIVNGVCLTLPRFFRPFLLLSLVFLSGCGITSFIGAYFNTYYNARKAFNEAESEVLGTGQQQTAAKKERPYLAPFEVPSQAKTKFATVIEKCSKLLQYHPDSKLVDDALMMIGKAYYYQNDHVAAERKFTELLSTYPESDLVLEAKLLLAQTHYRRNDRAGAARIATELLSEAQAKGEDAIVAETSRLLGHLARGNSDYREALRYFQTAAELGDAPEDRAAAYRNVAEMYVELGEYAGAAKAYAQSVDAGSSYISEYRGLIGQARMLTRLGRYDESLALLEEMASNQNYREFFGEINLEIANVYRDQKDYSSAEAQYRYVDTAYARTEVAANAYYQLGLLYEHHFRNYDSARAAYDKGRTEFPAAEVTVELLKRSDYFNRYFAFRNEILRNDSLLRVILSPPDTSGAACADSAKSDATSFASAPGDTTRRAPPAPPPPMDTVLARLAHNTSELASLFYTALDVVDSAKFWYQRLLEDHPKSTYAPRALYTLAQISRKDTTQGQSYGDSLLRKIIEEFPSSEFALAARRLLGMPVEETTVDSTELEYRLAEKMIEQEDYPAALQVLRRIAESDSTSPFAAKAQYAIGWIYENRKPDRDSSIAHYQRLMRRFPRSPYASVVQPKLALVEADRGKQLPDTPRDTTNVPVSPKIIPEPTGKVLPGTEQPPVDSLHDEVPKLRKKE